jgi:hypothetical protein
MKIYKHFLREFELEKNSKKCFHAQKFKMAAEFKMAVKWFFLFKNFKNDIFSKKLFLLYFLTNNTTFVSQFLQQIFFS